jgi:hypothetical protein
MNCNDLRPYIQICSVQADPVQEAQKNCAWYDLKDLIGEKKLEEAVAFIQKQTAENQIYLYKKVRERAQSKPQEKDFLLQISIRHS